LEGIELVSRDFYEAKKTLSIESSRILSHKIDFGIVSLSMHLKDLIKEKK
jgi:hypothetical protein